MTNSEFFDITEELEWPVADSDCYSYDLKAQTEKFTIWMEPIDGTFYITVSGKLNANGTWTIRCRKSRLKRDSHPVKNTVSEITVQAINDVIKDWFESNKDSQALWDDEDERYW